MHRAMVGGSSQLLPSVSGPLVDSTTNLAHQLSRTFVSSSGFNAFQNNAGTQFCSGSDRQFHDSSLHQQMWGDQVSPVMSHSLGSPIMVCSTQSNSSGHSCSGDFQSAGRRSFERQGGTGYAGCSGWSGMVSESGRGESNLYGFGISTGGSVCDVSQQQTEALLQLVPGPTGGGVGCVVSNLERFSVCVPTSADAQESDHEGEVRSRPGHCDSAVLASEAVVFSTDSFVSGYSDLVTTTSGSVVSEGIVSSQSTVPQTSGLENLWQTYRAAGISEEVIGTLQGSRRDSTKEVYQAQWRVFSSWCGERGHDPLSLPIAGILEFLQFLFNSGRAVSTIRSYTSAFTAIRGRIEGYTFSTHPWIAQFLKAVLLKRPPVKTLVPTWDLDIVLTYLQSEVFEPMEEVPLSLWTLKTVFLLAITSACRCGELQALDIREGYMAFRRTNVSLRTNITFVPKVAKPDYINRVINLDALKTSGSGKVSKRLLLLCPVRALRIYLDKSKSVRQQDVFQLFVTYGSRGAGSPVSKQRIASWLVQCIKNAYVHVGMEPPAGLKAHSTRSMSTSVACEKGMPMEDICQAATWAQGSVFAKFYRLDTVSRKPSLSTVVLSSKK